MPDTDTLDATTRQESGYDFKYKPAGEDDKGLSQDQALAQFIQDLKGEVEGDIKDRNTYSRKQVVNYQMRRCQIGKKDKNFPFPNSSDVRYPMIEDLIREKKPGYMSMIFDAPKIVRYSPGAGARPEAKERREFFANYLYRTGSTTALTQRCVPRFKKNMAATIDKHLEQGQSYVKVTWEHRVEWRTEVFLKEDGDKLKALITQDKIATVGKMFMGYQQAVQQAQQQGTEPPPPMQQPTKKQLEPTKKEMVEAFAELQKVDLEDAKDRECVEKAIQQYLDGEETITWMHRATVAHRPLVELIPENQAVITPVTTAHLQSAERITHEMYYTNRQLLEESDDNGGKYQNVALLIEHYKGKPEAPIKDDRLDMESARAAAEGVKQVVTKKDEYRIHETYCWVPRKHISRYVGLGGDDDTPVKAVITYCPDVDPNDVPPLRLCELPYDHQEWPIHKFVYNYRIDRETDPQGVAELCYPFNVEYNTAKNASFDRTTITMAPPTLIWDQLGITPQQFRQPGQVLKTGVPPGQNGIYTHQYPDMKRDYEMDASASMAWARQIIGANVSETFQNRVTSPTKAEVMNAQLPSNSIDHFEYTMFLDTLDGVFRQVDALCKQYMFLEEDTYEFPRSDKPDEVQKISKADFDGEWIITSGGDPSKGDPQLELQKYMVALQLVHQYPDGGAVVKSYDLWNSVLSKLVGYAESAAIMNDRGTFDKAQQAIMKGAQDQMQRQMEGKRPQRGQKIKQPSGAPTSLVMQ